MKKNTTATKIQNNFILKTLIRLALVFSLVLAAGLGTAFLCLQTDSGKTWALAKITAALEQSTSAGIDVGQISGNLLTKAILHNVTIYGEDPLKPLFEIKEAIVEYPFPPRIAGRFHVNRLTVSGLSVHLAADEYNNWNTAALLPRSFTHQGSGKKERQKELNRPGGFKLSVRDVIIKDANLTLSWHAFNRRQVLRFTNGECQAGLNISRQIRISIQDLAFGIVQPHAVIQKVSGGIEYDLSRHRLIFDQTRVKTQESQMDTNGHIDFAGGVNFSLAGDLQRISADELGEMFFLPVTPEINIAGNVSVRGRLDNLVHKFRLQWESSLIEGRATANYKGKSATGFSADIGFKQIHPEAFPIFPQQEIGGRATGRFQIRAEGLRTKHPLSEMTLFLEESNVMGIFAQKAEIMATTDGSDLIVRQLTADTQAGQIKAEGTIGRFFKPETRPFSFQAQTRNLDLSGLSPKTPWPSQLNLEINARGRIPASGSILDSETELRIEAKPSEVTGHDIYDAGLHVTSKEGSLEIHSFHVRAKAGQLQTSGEIGLSQKNLNLFLSADISEPAVLKPLFTILKTRPEHGSISLEASIYGNLMQPEIQFAFKAEKMRAKNWTCHRADLEGKWKGSVSTHRFAFNAKARDLVYRGLKIDKLSAGARAEGSTADWNINAVLDTGDSLGCSGSVPGYTNPEKTLELKDFYYKPAELPAINSTGPVRLVLTDNGHLHIRELELAWQKAGLKASGRLDLAGDGQVQTEIHIKNIDFWQLHQYFPKLSFIHGLASADLYLAGTLKNPEISLDAAATDPTIGNIRFSSARLAGRYDSGKINWQANALSHNAGSVAGTGTLAARFGLVPFVFLPKSDGLDGQLAIKDFAICASDFTDARQFLSRGILNARARLDGDIKHPEIRADIHFSEGLIQAPSYGLNWEGITADLQLEPDMLYIKNFTTASQGKESISVRGTIAHDHFIPGSMNIRLTGRDIGINHRDAAIFNASPDLTVSGTLAEPEIRGDVRIENGEISMERVLRQGPAEIEVIHEPAEQAEIYHLPERGDSRPWVDWLAADIHIYSDKNLWIKGDDINAQIAGNLRVEKQSGAAVRISGPLDVLRGNYFFRDRICKLRNGEIVFSGTEKIDPDVSIHAETRINGVTIIISLSGSARNLELFLSSEPEMDQVDIISYLLFGRAKTDLSTAESFRAEEAALSITGQLAADQIRQILGKSFPLDLLHISAGNGDLAQGGLSMGKYLRPNVFVTYSQGFSEAATSSLAVDYEINRNFSLEAHISEEQTSAVDLVWRHDFSAFPFSKNP